MSVKILIDKVTSKLQQSHPTTHSKYVPKSPLHPAVCCYQADALPDFLRVLVRVVIENDGSIQDFDESNFAMTRRNEEAKGEVVCKGVEESDQKADKGLTACKITLT